MNPVVYRLSLCVLLLLSTLFTTLFAQEILLKQPVELKSGLSDSREAFPIVNEVSQEVCLILMDNNSIDAYLLDSAMQVKKHLTFKEPNALKLLTTPVGSFINGNSYVMVGQQGYKPSYFTFLEMNFDSDKITFLERWKLSFPEGDELMSTFSDAGKFYALAVIKKSPALRLYKVDKTGNQKVMTFDLPEDIVLSKKHKDLHHYFRKDDVEYNTFEI